MLSTLLGTAGFQALLSRAVTLAKADVPGLAALEIATDGSLDGLSLDEHSDGKRPFSDGEVIFVAHFLGLLLTFLGEALMLRLVNDAWPKLSLTDLDFDKGTNRE